MTRKGSRQRNHTRRASFSTKMTVAMEGKSQRDGKKKTTQRNKNGQKKVVEEKREQMNRIREMKGKRRKELSEDGSTPTKLEPERTVASCEEEPVSDCVEQEAPSSTPLQAEPTKEEDMDTGDMDVEEAKLEEPDQQGDDGGRISYDPPVPQELIENPDERYRELFRRLNNIAWEDKYDEMLQTQIRSIFVHTGAENITVASVRAQTEECNGLLKGLFSVNKRMRKQSSRVIKEFARSLFEYDSTQNKPRTTKRGNKRRHARQLEEKQESAAADPPHQEEAPNYTVETPAQDEGRRSPDLSCEPKPYAIIIPGTQSQQKGSAPVQDTQGSSLDVVEATQLSQAAADDPYFLPRISPFRGLRRSFSETSEVADSHCGADSEPGNECLEDDLVRVPSPTLLKDGSPSLMSSSASATAALVEPIDKPAHSTPAPAPAPAPMTPQRQVSRVMTSTATQTSPSLLPMPKPLQLPAVAHAPVEHKGQDRNSQPTLPVVHTDLPFSSQLTELSKASSRMLTPSESEPGCFVDTVPGQKRKPPADPYELDPETPKRQKRARSAVGTANTARTAKTTSTIKSASLQFVVGPKITKPKEDIESSSDGSQSQQPANHGNGCASRTPTVKPAKRKTQPPSGVQVKTETDVNTPVFTTEELEKYFSDGSGRIEEDESESTRANTSQPNAERHDDKPPTYEEAVQWADYHGEQPRNPRLSTPSSSLPTVFQLPLFNGASNGLAPSANLSGPSPAVGSRRSSAACTPHSNRSSQQSNLLSYLSQPSAQRQPSMMTGAGLSAKTPSKRRVGSATPTPGPQFGAMSTGRSQQGGVTSVARSLARTPTPAAAPSLPALLPASSLAASSSQASRLNPTTPASKTRNCRARKSKSNFWTDMFSSPDGKKVADETAVRAEAPPSRPVPSSDGKKKTAVTSSTKPAQSKVGPTPKAAQAVIPMKVTPVPLPAYAMNMMKKSG